MAVEKIGDDEGAKKQSTCKHCGSILRYLPKDVETAIDHSFGETSAYSFIKCPACGNTVSVKA